MTLRKPAIYTHPTPSTPQPDLNPEPEPVLTAADRNDEFRRALVQKAFGSAQPVTGAIGWAGRHIGATERQMILQRVLEHGTHRGDVFEDEAHTRAVLNGCEFTLQDGALLVKVSR
jgi:hypothetical protein